MPELEKLSSLEELTIRDCKNIQSLTRFPGSLKKLGLIGLDGSDAAPPWNSECLVNMSELLIPSCSWKSFPETEQLSSPEELRIDYKRLQKYSVTNKIPGSLKKLKLECSEPSNEHIMISQFLVNFLSLRSQTASGAPNIAGGIDHLLL